MRRLSVILDAAFFPPSVGGVEAFTEMLATYLGRAGVDVLVTTRTPGPEMPGRPYKVLRNPSLRKLAAAVRSADAALMMGFHLPLATLARTRGLPCIWVHHNHDTICPKNYGYRWQDDRFCTYSPVQCHRCLSEDHSPIRELRATASFYLRQLFFDHAVHVAPAEIVRRRLRTPTGEVIPNGCELELFAPAEDGARDLDRVLFIGRLIPEKGGHIFIEALALARAEGAPALRGAILGDGPERQRLERLALSLGLEKAVEFRGTVSRDRLPREIRASLGVVNAQLWDWVLGISAIEVLSCGRPLISTRPEDEAEIPEGVALLVRRGDPAELARAMVRVRNDQGLRSRLEVAGRAFAVERHGVDDVGRRYLDLLRRITPRA